MRNSDLLASEAPHDASAQIPNGKLRHGAAVSEDFLKLKPKLKLGAANKLLRGLSLLVGRQKSKRKFTPKTSG